METHAIVCDLQAPYHDPAAVDVACQILEAAKPDTFTSNGDGVDFRKLALRYPSDDGAGEGLLSELKTEIERSREVILKLHKAAKPKKWAKWVDGNHEYRLWRAMAQTPQTLQLLGIKAVRSALETPSLLGLEKRFKYVGPYPQGFWLRDDLPPEKNVWLEHGYLVRKKGGYTATALMEERMTSVICGHVERLAEVGRKVIGNRWLFAIEGGNLSRIGEEGKGEHVYTGIPHSVPGYMSHQQGFVLVHYDSGEWWPELIRIKNGKAVFRGKMFKA